MDENLEEFLKALYELSKKHNIEIGGCGCCASPYLAYKNPYKIIAGNLNYNEEQERYTLNGNE